MTAAKARALARSRPPAAAAHQHELRNEAPCNAQAEAIDRQTDVLAELANEIRQSREVFVQEIQAFKPAAEALSSLGEAQRKLCNFIVNHRLKLLLGGIAALVAIGGISPNLATALGSALKALGWS